MLTEQVREDALQPGLARVETMEQLSHAGDDSGRLARKQRHASEQANSLAGIAGSAGERRRGRALQDRPAHQLTEPQRLNPLIEEPVLASQSEVQKAILTLD